MCHEFIYTPFVSAAAQKFLVSHLCYYGNVLWICSKVPVPSYAPPQHVLFQTGYLPLVQPTDSLAWYVSHSAAFVEDILTGSTRLRFLERFHYRIWFVIISFLWNYNKVFVIGIGSFLSKSAEKAQIC